MAVYFVYRTQFGAPGERFVRRFEHDTVLEWAQFAWKLHDTREAANKYGGELLTGIDTDAFHTMFLSNEEYTLAHRPRNMADVKKWFDSFYCEDTAHGAHHIQCLTEWGTKKHEDQRALYVFDDHYRAKKPGKSDFLLMDGWELPDGDSDAPPPKLKTNLAGRVKGAGKLYYADTYVDAKYNLEDLCGASSIAGLRVPDLARFLLTHPKPDELDYLLAVANDGLRAVLEKPTGEDAGFLVAIRDQPTEQTHWDVYSDWLQDRDLPPAGAHLLGRALAALAIGADETRRPDSDRLKTTAHIVQACKHRSIDSPAKQAIDDDHFAQLFFFDDRWAAAHPTLAAGILTFASRWDVLS